MSRETDLRKIELQMIKEYFEDGINELFFGIIFLWVWIIDFFSIEVINDKVTSLIVVIPMGFMFWTTNITRKKLVYPRTGYVNQEKYGKRQIVQAVLLMILALALIFFITWILHIKTGFLYPFFSKNISFILAITSAGYLALTAKITTIKRFYLYALASALIFILAGFISFDVNYYILYFSLVLIFSGAYLLFSFLKTHPVLELADEKSEDKNQASEIDPLIHAPSRFQIMANLYLVKEADFLFLLKKTGLTKGNLSAHLMKLEKAKYIVIDKTFEGKISRTIVYISNIGKKAFEDYRKTMKKMLE